jgi:hypothetical protein
MVNKRKGINMLQSISGINVELNCSFIATGTSQISWIPRSFLIDSFSLVCSKARSSVLRHESCRCRSALKREGAYSENIFSCKNIVKFPCKMPKIFRSLINSFKQLCDDLLVRRSEKVCRRSQEVFRRFEEVCRRSQEVCRRSQEVYSIWVRKIPLDTGGQYNVTNR